MRLLPVASGTGFASCRGNHRLFDEPVDEPRGRPCLDSDRRRRWLCGVQRAKSGRVFKSGVLKSLSNMLGLFNHSWPADEWEVILIALRRVLAWAHAGRRHGCWRAPRLDWRWYVCGRGRFHPPSTFASDSMLPTKATMRHTKWFGSRNTSQPTGSVPAYHRRS